MRDYTIIFTRSASKELESLDTSVLNRLFSKIENLAKNPRPKGCRKIQGQVNLWRIRVNEYRIIYSIDKENRSIDIIAIGHRREVYRHME